MRVPMLLRNSRLDRRRNSIFPAALIASLFAGFSCAGTLGLAGALSSAGSGKKFPAAVGDPLGSSGGQDSEADLKLDLRMRRCSTAFFRLPVRRQPVGNQFVGNQFVG
jgi:hypothetical protein